jgi:hypothetical protein
MYFGSAVGVVPALPLAVTVVPFVVAEADPVMVSSCSSVQTLPRLSKTCSNNLVSSVLRLEGGRVDADLVESEDMNASTGVVGVDRLRSIGRDLLVGVKGPLSRFRDAAR